MADGKSPGLTWLWRVTFAVQAVVLVILLARWAGSGRWQPPSLMIPLVLGTAGIALGLKIQQRLLLWAPSWLALGYVVGELVQFQLRLERGLPGMYLLVFVGAGLVTLACVLQLRADRRWRPS